LKNKGLMENQQRHKRLRLLTKKLNKERKKQAKKIDILCNDLIAAQRGFIKKLNTITFTTNFYETIIGTADLSSLILAAAQCIKDELSDANIAFFLRSADNFELHMFETDHPATSQKQQLESCFTPELVENICKSNKICTLDDMLSMGLAGNPTCINKLSAATIPLGHIGPSLGFILIYRSSKNKLNTEELNHISAITIGLSKAIASHKVPAH
jgi:hypothetical protein